MHLDGFGPCLLVDDPVAASRVFLDHFGFQETVRLDWFVDLAHPDHPGNRLSFVRHDHASVPAAFRNRPTNLLLFFVVPDAAAEYERLKDIGLEILQTLTDQPWGNRNFVLRGPGDVMIDVVQLIPPTPAFLAEHGLAAP